MKADLVDPADYVVGKLYMIRGGIVLRYHGVVKSKFERRDYHWHGFRAPGDQLDAPSGQPIPRDDVLREVTKDDLPGLQNRVLQASARGLKADAEVTQLVIDELLGVRLPPVSEPWDTRRSE